MALIIALTPFSFRVTFAEDNNDDEVVSEQELLDIASVIDNGINKEGSDYKLDVRYAKKKDLSPYVIDNLQDYLDQAKNSEVKDVVNSADDLKETIKENSTDGLVSFKGMENKAMASAGSKTKKALIVLFWGCFGVTMANRLADDVYKIGAYATCHKYGKKSSKVKNVCKHLGYW